MLYNNSGRDAETRRSNAGNVLKYEENSFFLKQKKNNASGKTCSKLERGMREVKTTGQG